MLWRHHQTLVENVCAIGAMWSCSNFRYCGDTYVYNVELSTCNFCDKIELTYNNLKGGYYI